ncbi:pantoate--beta-alanine ligase [Halodesulfovibrio spirochaetisodalis]|uniref:Pantothenate synthetase n=1 Tax=Halodesulfovibrio spirochaetisodalis TaxID=1560234 RepID=A0A1B7XPS5_9BACT|nr:pantoate--beta-alanine ligase [Halodesulfovibrio spirochaetisodalis]OBQ57505.1 pantoate--beta-alanine ligase [Halodesulfovibrio spirochaetisodalis]
MQIITSPAELQKICLKWRCEGIKVGLVPTMGYFHEGHKNLMRIAREKSDKLIVSLFVNPTQFAANEDLDAYPTNHEGDAQDARELGTDILFIPEPGSMYAEDHATWVEVPNLAKGLCSETRPTHFRGVSTVVTKLLVLTLPEYAVFGEKDWQQLAIIRRLTRDLNLPTTIIGGPLIREDDGLAMSSRNAYLTPEERAQAKHINAGIRAGAAAFEQGERDVEELKKIIRAYWAEHLPLGKEDYLEFIDPDSMEPVTAITDKARCATAVYVGKGRLLDNWPFYL